MLGFPASRGQPTESFSMTEVSRILSAIEQGDPQAAEQLLPLVYDELRQLAAQRLAQEKPGQTLQATALVHEAQINTGNRESGRERDSWRSCWFVRPHAARPTPKQL